MALGASAQGIEHFGYRKLIMASDNGAHKRPVVVSAEMLPSDPNLTANNSVADAWVPASN
jgi:hypothetical protein